tara:strand:- start:245 stop:487 length:243 start_codon:yes stop_codon:yes gene_type:complete
LNKVEKETKHEILVTNYRELLNYRFDYANDTERNKSVKNEIDIDTWNIFRVLVDENNFDAKTTTSIFAILQDEIKRLKKI